MTQISKKFLGLLIIFVIISSTLSINVSSFEKSTVVDLGSLSFKQEIEISLDTSLEVAKFQPIDIRINFDNNCWAKNADEHSIRVAYGNGGDLTEIESQIYDLEYGDNDHITSCSLVFLIPEVADGTEKYYVLYDSSETDIPSYKDHLILEDTHYYYEPISGQKIDFDYYKVTEDGYIIYLIVQKGELIGNPISLSVAKFKPKSTVAETYNIDQLGAFDMRYGTFEEPGYIGSAWATEVNKNVLVDGNLMIRVRLESIAPRGDIKSDNIYTYYYCPSETKRIYVNVNHEVLKTHKIENPKIYDGAYAGIVSIKSRSATIEKMNVGEILPQLSLYDKNNFVKEYSVPINPDSIVEEEILSTQDDIDLGKNAWVCLGRSSTGKSHGLILSSSTGLVDGAEDGIQVKAFVKQNIKLPGLEADTGNLFLLKNSYDSGRAQNTVLNQGFKVSFDAELITVENGGHEKINAESQIFQNMIKNVPIYREGIVKAEEAEVEKYTLKTSVHLAPSVPLGSLLCAAVGKNVPYIYAELYKENSFRSSGSVGRISLVSIELDFEGKNIFQTIKSGIALFDWKNATLSKTIVFPDLEVGTYLVKIYKENPFFAKERQYIGFQIVDVKEDTSTKIYCRFQGSVDLTVVDQNNNGIENVEFLLKKDDVIISESYSDKNGTSSIVAPCHPLHPYTFNVLYNGFLVDEKEVKFGIINRLLPIKNSYDLELFDLELKVKDTWGFEPAVDITPILTSDEMIKPNDLTAEKQSNAKYFFANLYSAKYNIKTSYKSFTKEEICNVDKDKIISFEFPAEFKVYLSFTNIYGMDLEQADVSLEREGKKVQTGLKDSSAIFSVPPGKYEINAYVNDKLISKQKIDVKGEKSLDILTKKDSNFHTIIFYLGILILILSGLYVICKKNAYVGIKIFIIAIILMSIVSPFWVLNGEQGNISTSTKTMLYPANIVSFTDSPDAIGGEVSLVPQEVTMVLGLLSLLLVLAGLITFFSILTKNRLNKTTVFLSVISIILLIVTISIFFYAMSMVTELGVGSFSGSGNLEITIPGTVESKTLSCIWGPGTGFYLTILSLMFLIFICLFDRIKQRKNLEDL